MGSGQSAITTQTLAAYTNIVNQVATNVYNQASQDCATQNVFQATFCPTFNATDSGWTLNQQASTRCTFNNQNVANLNATFANQLQTTTQSFITDDLKNQQGFFATAFSFQLTDASTTQDIMNQMTNLFTSNFTNLCSAVSTSLNSGIVNFCGTWKNSPILINQNSLVTSITSCVNEAVANIWQSNQVLNDLYTMTNNKLSSTQEGIASIFIYILIGLGILAIIGLIGGIIYAMINKGNKGSGTSLDTLTELNKLRAGGKAKASIIPKATTSALPKATTSALPKATTSIIPKATTSIIPKATTSALPTISPTIAKAVTKV
jgi:hypothetical protein